jgi:hypothetical protein
MPRIDHNPRRPCNASSGKNHHSWRNRKENNNPSKGSNGKDNDRKKPHKDNGKNNAKDGLVCDHARWRVPLMVKCQTNSSRKKGIEARKGTRCRDYDEVFNLRGSGISWSAAKRDQATLGSVEVSW